MSSHDCYEPYKFGRTSHPEWRHAKQEKSARPRARQIAPAPRSGPWALTCTSIEILQEIGSDRAAAAYNELHHADPKALEKAEPAERDAFKKKLLAAPRKWKISWTKAHQHKQQ